MVRQLRSGDTVVVWKLDRLRRSLRDLIELVAEFQERGVEFVSLQDGINTATPTGRFTFNIIASLAELESEIIREHTKAGLFAAKARARRAAGQPVCQKSPRRRLAPPDHVRLTNKVYGRDSQASLASAGPPATATSSRQRASASKQAICHSLSGTVGQAHGSGTPVAAEAENTPVPAGNGDDSVFAEPPKLSQVQLTAYSFGLSLKPYLLSALPESGTA